LRSVIEWKLDIEISHKAITALIYSRHVQLIAAVCRRVNRVIRNIRITVGRMQVFH